MKKKAGKIVKFLCVNDVAFLTVEELSKVAETPIVVQKQLPVIKTKTFNFDGLELSREPNELEKLIGLKSLVSDLEAQSESLEKSLLKYRDALISQAVALAKKLDDKTIFTLTLERNEKLAKVVSNSLFDGYLTGRAQIEREINLQRTQKSLPNLETKDLEEDLKAKLKRKLSEITDAVLSKILNEIQSRTINIHVALKLLGIDAEMFFEEMKKRLQGESTKFIESLSKDAANLFIQTGRGDEIETQNENWQRVEYSAILDKNTCYACKKADGLKETELNKLPKVPNKLCDGGARCRCFHVVILD